MNSELKSLLGINCKILEKPDNIKVHYIEENMMANQENYVKCTKTELGWTVYKCSRGQDFEIGTFKEKDYALCVLYIYYASTYQEPEINHSFLRILRKYENYSEISEAYKLIETKCESKYFSKETPRKNTICLDYTNNLFTIYYLKRDNTKLKIVECEHFSRAICVLYNYSIILKNFNNVYENLLNANIICENNYEELLQYYFHV